MRYHGNYCGPNWSAGLHQASVISDVPAIDEFDATCKEHDGAYALHGNLSAADQQFYKSNMWRGPKRTAAALAVKVQQLARDNILNMTQPRLRGASNATKTTTTTTTTKAKGNVAHKPPQHTISTTNVPSAIGTSIRGSSTRTTKKTDSNIRMSASVCIGRPGLSMQTLVPELNGLIVLNPVSLGSDEIQNMTRVYQHYRMHRATLHYRPIAGTSTAGETIIVSNSDPNYKPIDTSLNSSFYQRALSTNHSVLTPVWLPASMELAVDTGLKVCDNLNSSTLEDFCSGVVYTYSDGYTASGGYFIIDVDIEFVGLRFNPRNVISGSRQGFGVRSPVTFVNPVLGADAISTNPGFTAGDIYLVVLSNTALSVGAPVTANNLFALSTGVSTTPFAMDGSTALYARASSSVNLTYFATYDAAVGYDVADRLLYGVSAPGTTNNIQAVMTQLRNSTQPSL